MISPPRDNQKNINKNGDRSDKLKSPMSEPPSRTPSPLPYYEFLEKNKIANPNDTNAETNEAHQQRLTAPANLRKVEIPYKKNSSVEYVISHGRWGTLTPPVSSATSSISKHGSSYYSTDFSPLSLALSTTSCVQLRESECGGETPNDDWCDSSNDSSGEDGEDDVTYCDYDEYDELENEGYWQGRSKSMVFNRNFVDKTKQKAYYIESQLQHNRSLSHFSYGKLFLTPKNSNVSDICWKFPTPNKREFIHFDECQKKHNIQINGNVNEIFKTIGIGQDVFHKFHIKSWKQKKREEKRFELSVSNRNNNNKKNKTKLKR